MFVKPGTDKRTNKPLVIRIPRTHARMPEAGMDVPQTAFWLRRLRDKDVVKATPPEPASASPSSPPAAPVSAPEKSAPAAPAAKAEAASA